MRNSPMPKILYGASYSPLIFTEADWDSDLPLMQAASMNLVRIGDVHGAWDRIEPRRGELELDVLARFYEKAHQYGVNVLLSTGSSAPPLWLATENPDVAILSSRGERYPLGASYHWACINHPAFLQASESYIRALCAFAVQQPNHFGWQITNEIGFPFLPAREQHELGLYCYCEHCQQGFRAWVKEKYGDLEALTEAWSWGTSNLVYNDWAEVSAPESMPASWAGVTRWMDWRLYWQDTFANFAGWQHQMIREIDKDHPTSVNTFNFKGYDRFGTFMGLDQWKIAKQVDHIGYDLYPGSGDKLASRPEHNSIFLDHGRSVSDSVGRAYWIHEVESGPIGGWLMGPQHNTDAADIHNYMVECIGHNAKLYLYMPWREWDYQPLRWGALVDLDGVPTPRLDAASTIGKVLADHDEFLLHAAPPQSRVALLESKPNAIFIRGTDDEELLFRAQRGAYRVFWEQGFNVDFLNEDLLFSEKIFAYKYICLPLVGLLSVDAAQRLAEFARKGGVVIGFSRLATMDNQGWFHHQLPIAGIKELFGLEKVEADTLPSSTINFQGKTFQPHLNRDIVTPGAETQVVGRFSDQLPAVTYHAYGQGGGVYIATQADGAFVAKEQDRLLEAVVSWINEKHHLAPQYEIDENDRAREIDPHILETEEKTWLLFSNYCETAKTIQIKLPSRGRIVESVWSIFPQAGSLDFIQREDIVFIDIGFNPKEVRIVEILWR